MLGLSRGAGPGGRYRTVPRFFSQALPWAMLFWGCFRQPIDRAHEVALLVGDAVVATKAGQPTSGLERFFSRLSGQPGPGRAFFTLSLVSTQPRRAFPIRVEHGGRSDTATAASQAQVDAKKQPPSTAQRRPGRPKGRPNTPQADVPRTPE